MCLRAKYLKKTLRYCVFINADNCQRIQLALVYVHCRSITQFKEGKCIRHNIGQKCKNYPTKVSSGILFFIFCVTTALLIFNVLELCLMLRNLATELIQCEWQTCSIILLFLHVLTSYFSLIFVHLIHKYQHTLCTNNILSTWCCFYY